MSHSPRSSVDALHSPTSPFLHNLSQRLRKSSNASFASSHSSETARSNADHLAQSQDTQSTKRYLLSILKDDWEYPTSQTHKNDLKLQREATGYRLRDESVSDLETSGGKRSAGREEDPYRFDNPDDVGAAIDRRRARKRRLIEQEMSWNEGLRIWTLRRDAWTGAVQEKPRSQTGESSGRRQKRLSTDKRPRISSDSTGGSSTSAPSWPIPDSNDGGDLPMNNPPSSDHQSDLQNGPFLPIYPPLLPASHILRSRIKPSAYPTLYSKVVLQGLAPNVPIPLNHMISALVEGWKAEGNWPPQPLAPETPASRQKQKKSESTFQKWKREQDEKRAAALQRSQEAHYEQEGHASHKGVRSSIGGVLRKMTGAGSSTAMDVDRDLEKIGLTFETEEEREEAMADTAATLREGHV